MAKTPNLEIRWGEATTVDTVSSAFQAGRTPRGRADCACPKSHPNFTQRAPTTCEISSRAKTPERHKFQQFRAPPARPRPPKPLPSPRSPGRPAATATATTRARPEVMPASAPANSVSELRAAALRGARPSQSLRDALIGQFQREVIVGLGLTDEHQILRRRQPSRHSVRINQRPIL